MQAMILAAGLGTRLWPLTCDRAKPAVPFLGRPLIAHLADHLDRHGLSEVVVNTHHQAESIARALGSSRPRTLFSHEKAILGTGGGIAWALSQRLLRADEPLLVVNGKIFTDIDLGEVIEAHLVSGSAVTMVLTPNSEREHFREVLTDGPLVTGFGEGRVPTGAAPLLFTGIHVLSPEVLRAIPVEFCDTVSDIYPPLIQRKRVRGHVVEGRRWWEFSTLSRYLGLHRRAHSEGLSPPNVLSTGASISPGGVARSVVLWESSRIDAGAEVENAVLGAGVVIRRGEKIRDAAVVLSEIVERNEGGYSWDDRLVVPVHSSTGP